VHEGLALEKKVQDIFKTIDELLSRELDRGRILI
jgi:hypothetical protein